jgi:uncharacterized membrane protein YgcG
VTRFRPLLALLLAALAVLAPALSTAKEPVVEGSYDAPPLAVVPEEPRFQDFDVPEIVAGERITSYRSEVDVGANGTLTVTETIQVNATGDRIEHGVYRDFPTVYIRDGRRVRVGFDLQLVQRDGQTEPYRVERVENGVRIKIGDPDALVPRGRHTYLIRYITNRQLGFFPTYDELYWNVTGTGWIFPIDRAEVRIRLPQAVPFGPERAVYTGPNGVSDRHEAEVVSERPGEIVFRTTERLDSEEGLTVAVRWQKGVVAQPAPLSRSRLWFQDYGPVGAAIVALIGLGFFYYYAWKKAGRGPVPGTVVPLFQPPDGLSAAAIRYIRRMGFDNRCFAAAIVDSGVHRKLRMEEGEKGFFSKAKTTLVRTARADDMPEPESRMLDALFAGGDSIEMDKSNHTYFGAARKALQENLQEAYQGRLFLKNLGWAWVGMVLMLAAVLFVGMVLSLSDPYANFGERALPATGFVLMVGAVMAGVHSRLAEKGGSWVRAGLAVLLGLGGSAFVVLAFINGYYAEGWLVLWMLAPLLILPVALSAFVWMAAPTPEGRQVMDRIAGFQRYLSITEEDRLEMLHPPEKTPELFERYLPHAIALGVENRWAGKFAAVLAAAAADPDRQGSTMGWYVGSHNAWSNPGLFVSTVGASLASSVASAATAPGSSSGSGGGGFSGGGGGGGGGGGW